MAILRIDIDRPVRGRVRECIRGMHEAGQCGKMSVRTDMPTSADWGCCPEMLYGIPLPGTAPCIQIQGLRAPGSAIELSNSGVWAKGKVYH